MGGAPAACQAGIVVIFTPLLWPAKVTVTVPPRSAVTQGAVRGTVTTLLAPVAVTGQPAAAVPETSWIFCVKKDPISPPTGRTDFCPLTISGALPAAGNLNGIVVVPAQLLKKTSPIWSACG